ncbi:MAG: hypothetical protein D6737_19540 [Chloroflexi bacterium]|nr:MAG: hypothetical protein D6737_19540 [Chloroflexota bacterium]
MRRSTLIVIFFALVAIAVIAFSQFLRSQPPLEITLVVSPLAEAWVRDSIDALNNSDPTINTTRRFRVNLSVINDIDAWNSRAPWTPENHPTAWLPASSTSVDYFNETRRDGFRVFAPSIVRTPFVWGAYQSRWNVLTDEGSDPLDWDAVRGLAAAESWSTFGVQQNWGFVKLGFNQPDRKMSGLAAILMGAAHFADNPATNTVTSSSAFRGWMQPVLMSVPNFSTLGGDPAAAMARGPNTVEIALFPESLWLENLDGMRDNENVRLSYPRFQFMLDFPLAIWNDGTVTEEERRAVEVVRNWLLDSDRQRRAQDFGLRPAQGEPDGGLFIDAMDVGIVLMPDYGQAVQAPSRGEALALLQWISSNIS